MQLGKIGLDSEVEVISSGSLSLDKALGIGGFPKGRIVEIYGPESSGKTTVALQVIAECQKNGGTAVFIDAEHALDPTYSKSIGVNLESLYVSQPDNGEQALDIVDTLVKSSGVDLVVVDSVAALVPKAELEGDMGDQHVALQARLMSRALRKLTASLSKMKTCIIFINQIRSKVGVVFGNPEVTSGGNALKFYCSVRLEVRKGQQIKKNGEIIGNSCKIKVSKNKLAPPFQTAEFDMIFGLGIDRIGELIDEGVKAEVVRKSGSWYSLSDDIDWPEGIAAGSMIGQGKEKVRMLLQDDKTMRDAVCSAVRDRMRKAHKEEEEHVQRVPLLGEAEAVKQSASVNNETSFQ